VVFEFGIVNNSSYREFEQFLISELRKAKIKYKLHWSKNSLIDKARLEEMYGKSNVDTWKKSRSALFNNEIELMNVFNNVHLKQAELNTP
jgi:hypothetical protein